MAFFIYNVVMTNYLEAKGWLTELERETLKYLAESAPKTHPIVNIGIEYGASVHCLRAGNRSGVIFAVDIIGDDKFEGDRDSQMIFHRQPSHMFIDAGMLMNFSLAFIDGDHGYKWVTIDCQLADRIIKDGFIIFHDCYSWEDPTQVHKLCPDVNAAVQDWFDAEGEGRFTELESKDSMRIFQRTA